MLHGATFQRQVERNLILTNITDDDRLEQCHDYIQVLFPLPESSMFSYNAPQINSNTLKAFRSNIELQMTLTSAFVRMLAFYGFEARVNTDPNAVEEEDSEDERVQPQQAGKGKEKAGDASGSEPSSTLPGTQSPSIEQKGDTIATLAPKTTPLTQRTTEPAANSSAQPPENPTTPTPLSPNLSDLGDIWYSISTLHIVRGPNFKIQSPNWCVRMDHNHLRITRILRCLRVLGLEKQSEEFYKALGEVFNDPQIHIGERSMEFWTRAVREPLYVAPDGKVCKWLKRWEEERHALDDEY